MGGNYTKNSAVASAAAVEAECAEAETPIIDGLTGKTTEYR